MTNDTRSRIIAAARECLLADGYAALSTRRVADAAGVPLSQIHYHFRSRRGLVLAMLDAEDQVLVQRQRHMYGTEAPLWKQYEQACDFLDDDLASGYVRVLQEMIAVGWADPAVAGQVLEVVRRWLGVLTDVAEEAQKRLGPFGIIGPSEIAGLVGLAFLGGEAIMLLGDERQNTEIRAWLRRFGDVIRAREEHQDSGSGRAARRHR
ncbi:MAG TPA: helix-turn-helix domain-containing protein [Micromonosporaceae bacterium]|jgi:AcrR family transcriptional regulator